MIRILLIINCIAGVSAQRKKLNFIVIDAKTNLYIINF